MKSVIKTALFAIPVIAMVGFVAAAVGSMAGIAGLDNLFFGSLIVMTFGIVTASIAATID